MEGIIGTHCVLHTRGSLSGNFLKVYFRTCPKNILLYSLCIRVTKKKQKQKQKLRYLNKTTRLISPEPLLIIINCQHCFNAFMSL